MARRSAERGALRRCCRMLPCILFLVGIVWVLRHHAIAHASILNEKVQSLVRPLQTAEPTGESLPQASLDHLGFVCANCSCKSGSYVSSKDFAVVPLEEIRNMAQGEPLNAQHATYAARSLYHRIVIDNLLSPVFTRPETVVHLWQQALSCPDTTFSFNLKGLVTDLPTMYAYTRTGSGGRLGAKRGKYFDRHIEAMNEYMSVVQDHGHLDGTPATGRQLIWIVVEDDLRIDTDLRQRLQMSGINHLYIAYGPTKHYAYAQWNLVWKCIEVLHTFFGDGPVVAVDDDGKVKPELYFRLWKLKKLMMWQMGNLNTGQGWWEGPRFEKGKIVQWTNSWFGHDRKFPVDMGAFAVNSSLVGTVLTGPQYIPADEMGQEDEFVQQIVEGWEEVEPLCENTVEDNCKFTWHNHYFPEDKIADPYNPEGINHE